MKKYFILVTCLQSMLCFSQVPAPYPTAPASPGNISRIEYFIDNRPEYGAGTAMTGFISSVDVNNINSSIDVTALPAGLHRIYFRSKDADGKWSVTNTAFFDNYNVPVYTPASPGSINTVEYFFNSNPAFGSGTPLTGFTAAPDIAGFSGSVSLTGVNNGLHRFFIRSKDAAGNWSLTNSSFFDNYNVPVYVTAPAPASINAIEYFFNSNPAFGSGIALNGFTPGPDISSFSGTVSLAGVTNGMHRFYMRSKDATGKWSLANNAFFDNFNLPVYNTAAPVTNMVQLEYFIDNNDAGFGACTPIALTPNVDISNLNANINVTGLPGGIHRLFIRGKDANGKWTLTNFSVFDNTAIQPYPAAPAAAPAVSTLEYFIDTDPGFGNGHPITVPANTGTINNFSVNISMPGNLSAGPHMLFIRSKQNPWSLTTIIPFSTSTPLPVVWSYVRAELTGNDQTLVSWATEQETNTDKFEIEHGLPGGSFVKIGEVPAAGSSNSIRNYSFLHLKPEIGFNHYRIKQVDLDGSSKYSPVLVVVRRNGLVKTLIAPNPVKDVLHVVEPKEIFIMNAEVYTIEGKILLRKQFNSNQQLFSIPVTQLPRGHYILKVQYRSGTKTYTFVKE